MFKAYQTAEARYNLAQRNAGLHELLAELGSDKYGVPTGTHAEAKLELVESFEAYLTARNAAVESGAVKEGA